MKVFIFSISLTLSLSSLADPQDWTRAEIEGSKIWQHSSRPEITGTLQRIKRAKPLTWTGIDKKTFYKDLEEKKIKVLTLIGVRDWKVDSYDWGKHRNDEKLTITGTYRDSIGVATYFKEVQVFSSDETVQILHTRPITEKNGPGYEEDVFNLAFKEVDRE